MAKNLLPLMITTVSLQTILPTFTGSINIFYMTHSEFMQLSAAEQYQLMAIEGVQIAQREDRLNKYCLYQLGSFYIEGKYNFNPHQLEGIRSFTSTMTLDSYIEKIDISQLVG